MAHGDAPEGKWRGNWRMEWVASTLHTTSEHGVSSITTADAHTLAASSRLNWRPRRFKWTRPFRRKTKSGFCSCAITFQTHYIFLSWLNVIFLFFTWSVQLVFFILLQYRVSSFFYWGPTVLEWVVNFTDGWLFLLATYEVVLFYAYG